MLNINYIAAFFMLIGCISYAQETGSTNTSLTSSFGVRGGYNLASVRTNHSGTTDPRHGFHIGVFGETYINEFISIQPEIVYSQQGYKIETNAYEFEQRINYINLPLLLKIYPAKIFYAEIGPQIGYAISHKEETKSGILNTTQTYDPNSFDWGLNFGLGFKTQSDVRLGIRHHYGLGDVYEDSDTFNSVWQFSIGFGF